MEQLKNSLSSEKVKNKKKALPSNAIRKIIAVLLGIMALLLAVLMVICNTGILFKMIAGIASIYIFWFAIDYYHK